MFVSYPAGPPDEPAGPAGPDEPPSGDGLRQELARLVRQLVNEAPPPDARGLGPRLRAFLGEGAGSQPVLREDLDRFDLPNLQLALDALQARPDWSWETLGIAGQGRHFSGMGLADLMVEGRFVNMGMWASGPPEYVNAEVGPGGRTLPCLTFGLLLATTPSGPLALFVRLGEEHSASSGRLILEGTSPVEGLVTATLADIRLLMAEHDIFRGQVLTVEAAPMGGSAVTFMERPVVATDDVVLPAGVLERIERHVAGPSRHRELLMATGRHLERGLLLWGPPGTGKTLTVRFLAGRLTDHTVIILTGSALHMAANFGTLARRLAPSVVILEDVDAVAEERDYDSFGSSVLFDLMDEMSGQRADADVAFVLTTNRPDVLEPALAARPGRVDLAVEIPLPDHVARRRLLDLYARGIDLHLDDPDAVVERTRGVTASFITELLRKAVLCAAEDGRRRVEQADVDAALDELLHETSALTRVLLGSGDPDRLPAGRAWLLGAGEDEEEDEPGMGRPFPFGGAPADGDT